VNSVVKNCNLAKATQNNPRCMGYWDHCLIQCALGHPLKSLHSKQDRNLFRHFYTAQHVTDRQVDRHNILWDHRLQHGAFLHSTACDRQTGRQTQHIMGSSIATWCIECIKCGLKLLKQQGKPNVVLPNTADPHFVTQQLLTQT